MIRSYPRSPLSAKQTSNRFTQGTPPAAISATAERGAQAPSAQFGHRFSAISVSSPAAAALATEGLKGPAQTLPHVACIQRAFGHHDVSEVEAHVGGRAQRSARLLNASAYATGNSVAFANAPDIATAAHEAAHIVQQRGGLRLKSGLGEAGDRYEQHADEVGRRVARGESVETLLDRVAPWSAPAPRRGQTARGPVQRTLLKLNTEKVQIKNVKDFCDFVGKDLKQLSKGDSTLISRALTSDQEISIGPQFEAAMSTIKFKLGLSNKNKQDNKPKSAQRPQSTQQAAEKKNEATSTARGTTDTTTRDEELQSKYGTLKYQRATGDWDEFLDWATGETKNQVSKESATAPAAPTTLNCWEFVLYWAVDNGFLDKSWLQAQLKKSSGDAIASTLNLVATIVKGRLNRMNAKPQEGNLIVLSDNDPEDPAKLVISHVAISLGDGKILHMFANRPRVDSWDAFVDTKDCKEKTRWYAKIPMTKTKQWAVT